MNILVTGANGQLGNEMRLVSRDSAHTYIFTDVVQADGEDTFYLDITDFQAVCRMVTEHKVDVIVNCAAYTDVDAAETSPELARRLNVEAPENLAWAVSLTGGLLVHISTDYVFGGELHNTPCTEEMKGAPTGVYGRTKLEGEEAVRKVGCNHVIIRTSWLYSEFGKNFCKKMLCLTQTKPEVKVVYDQVGTPTYAQDLAKAVQVVISDYASDDFRGVIYAKTGTYHYSNEGECSWYDFAKAIARYSGHTQCVISPCRSDEFPSPVRRPAYSVLDKTKIKNVFGVKVPYWKESLKSCIDVILSASRDK